MNNPDPWDVNPNTEEVYHEEVPAEASPVIIPQKKKPTIPFYPSQTLIKQITDHHGNMKEYCARQIMEIYIRHNYKGPQTENMMNGCYFETLCLGSSRDEETTLDLPKNKITGAKKKDQMRIEIQASRFPIICEQNMISIIPGYNTQVPIYKKLGNTIWSGVLDIFPTPILLWNTEIMEYELHVAVIDLKLTGDVNSKFGDFCWGAPEYMDHVQGDHYLWLVKDFDLLLNKKLNSGFDKRVGYENIFTSFIRQVIEHERIKFFYLIFGYRASDLNTQIKFVERLYKEKNNVNRPEEHIQRMHRTLGELDIMAEEDYHPNPSQDRCKECPVRKDKGGYCNEYNRHYQV